MIELIKKITAPALVLKTDLNPLPSEWLEQNRYVQKAVSSRLEGMLSFKNTPYMKEIIDHLDPYSPVTHVILEKGVRMGASFILEDCGVPYIISERPTSTLVVSATKDLARERMEGIDFGIDGCKVRYLIGKGTGVQSNSKGDTANYKSFSGGFKLFNAGGQSDTEFRSITAGIIFIDEVDAMKFVSASSGAVTELFEDRAITYGETKKIFYLSSPLLLQTSVIHAKYLEGDQNKYLVPCPNCGEFIELVWNERNENNTRYGVIFDVNNNEVVKDSVRYRCGLCENEFRETKKLKLDILNAGYWQPTFETMDPNYKSYHISALYAPPTFDNWYDFAKTYQKAFPRGGIKDNGKYQHFLNSILGKPYKPEGITIKSTQLQSNRRDYKIGELPSELSKKDGNGEIVIISLSVDLNGWDSDPDNGDDARIDFEIMGHSETQVTYSIDAGSLGTFKPKVELRALKAEGVDIFDYEKKRTKYSYKLGVKNSVWDLLEEQVKRTFGEFERKIDIIALDVGSFNEYAMEWAKRMRAKGFNVLPVMGAKKEIFASRSRKDTEKIWKLAEREDTFLINVNVIKDNLAKYIMLADNVDDTGHLHQFAHHLNFPEYDKTLGKYTYRNYFAHYEAEELKEKKAEGVDTKYMWEKKRAGIQNHFWDVATYNQFCQIYYMDTICKAADKRYKDEVETNWKNTVKLVKDWYRKKNLRMS